MPDKEKRARLLRYAKESIACQIHLLLEADLELTREEIEKELLLQKGAVEEYEPLVGLFGSEEDEDQEGASASSLP